jgi:3-dehydroquinate synthase
VESDEKDMGLRNILNFGHTLGHAVESVSNFKIAHGQGVSIGMVAAAKIAVKLNIMTEPETIRLTNLLAKAGLKTHLPGNDIQQLLQTMRLDKKVQSGKIRFILPRRIGEVFITDDVNPAVVEKVLMEMT